MAAVNINLKSVAKRFNTFRGVVEVLREVDLEVNPGEFFVLLGPSGCGKSTLLNLLAGLEKPSGGSIHFGGDCVADPAKGIFRSPFDRDVAMVFQSYALYPHMTVAENIAFPLTNLPKPLSRSEIETKVKESAVFLQIENLLDRKPAELSGGQRQRVAIGRAIVRNPKVCLMDEPLSNLDAKLRMDMRAQLKDLQNRMGITTVYVTHDQLEAMTLGHRIAVLNSGYLQQVGTPVDVYRKPANEFVARFVGSPSMNMIEGVPVHENGRTIIRGEGISLLLPLRSAAALQKTQHSSVTAGIRPEHLIPVSGEGNITLRINVVENIGSELLLYSFVPSGQIVARTQTSVEGDNISFMVDETNVHLFDEDGIRIGD